MPSNRIVTCTCCGEIGRHGGYGWRAACYNRWRRNGEPKSGPPAPMTPAERARRPRRSAPRLERLDEFAMVRRTRTREDGEPISIAEAAAAVGVSARTGQRYATALAKATQ
jgi:hypothetical protein